MVFRNDRKLFNPKLHIHTPRFADLRVCLPKVKIQIPACLQSWYKSIYNVRFYSQFLCSLHFPVRQSLIVMIICPIIPDSTIWWLLIFNQWENYSVTVCFCCFFIYNTMLLSFRSCYLPKSVWVPYFTDLFLNSAIYSGLRLRVPTLFRPHFSVQEPVC